MKTENLISTEDYFCNPDICIDCYEHVLDSINMAEALVIIAGKQFIDFTQYNDFISGFLNELKDKAQETGSFSDVYEYVSVSTGFFDTRHEFINHLGVEYSKNNPDKVKELKRLYEISAPGYRNLAEHASRAHELLFQSEPAPMASGDPQNSSTENRDSE